MNSFANLAVEPIFATPLAMLDLEGDPTLTKESISDIEDWRLEDGQGISPGHHFLARHPVLAEQILEAFYAFKGGWLGLSRVDFIISSSWMTRCEPGYTGQSHRHYNSMFTGVYYPFDDEYSNLEFSRSNIEPNSFLIDRDTANMFSMASAQIKPKKNLTLFFPSYVSHRIMRNTSEHTRYSIAFNFHPVGAYGEGDSTIHIIGAKPKDE